MPDSRELEAMIWRIVDGHSTEHDEAVLHEHGRASLTVLDRLVDETAEQLASARRLPEHEREPVVDDFTDMLRALQATVAILRPPPPVPIDPDDPSTFEPEPVRLQASWANGQVVVWAGGRGVEPESNDELATRLEAIDGPPLGWELHAGVPLPDGSTAEALSIPMKDALGWLVAVGSGNEGRHDLTVPSTAASNGDGSGSGEGSTVDAASAVAPSVHWLGRVAVEGVRLAASGSIVPSVRVNRRNDGRQSDANVRWLPILSACPTLDALGAAMPGTVGAIAGGTGRATAVSVITAVVEAIVAQCVERMQLPAAPPNANSPADLADSIIAHMDGAPFPAHTGLSMDLSRRFDQWSRALTDQNRTRLLVELAAPGADGVWLVSVFASAGKGPLTSIDTALRAEGGGRTVASEWQRLGRLLPALDRVAVQRRGQVALSQDEAWHFMTVQGPVIANAGFDVRVPALSRRKPKPSLRLFAEAASGSIVGAHQLSNVAWSVLFDDVELTAAEIRRLAKQARPLVQSRGKWIEVDRVDLEQAAAALDERASITSLTGAEILRHQMGLDDSGLSGGTVVHGDSWANDIVQKATGASTSPVTSPEGFVGELRTYQAEALGWLGFLDAAELGGCLALDMGLGKTPTVLAHLARTAGDGPVLVIAPAAVVGNWAAEAARFAPKLRVVVHHGATRSEDAELARVISRADVVITTYATAVRDMDALVATNWRRIVLDEAQAIKNPTSETSQQLRRIPARSRIALTGTPIENGLGDLWAILDFTNPGLVGTRPSFIAQMSGDGEAALRALNGILLFRRTKTEPEVAKELPDKIDELDHCTMTPEQIGLYQAVLDTLVLDVSDPSSNGELKQGAVLAAITALKQICNHPAAYRDDGQPIAGRSGKLARLEEIVESVFAAGERVLVFTHFATWGRRLAEHLTQVTGVNVACYDGSLARGQRDRLVDEFQHGTGAGAMVLSLKAGGTGLNLTSANHVVLYDRWWNPAVEDQARDRAWRLGQGKTVISHRLVCPGTIDERVEEVVAGERHVANLVLPSSSSLADLSTDQLRLALGLRPEELLTDDGMESSMDDSMDEDRLPELTGGPL